MQSLTNDVFSIWQDLHDMPEKGFEEVKTSAYLADKLNGFGYKVQTGVGGTTGVVGVLDSGKPGPVVALRADMDALVHEKDGELYATHSCGHDVNSAMVLAAAGQIAKDGLSKGKVKIIFQPAEELLTGASAMIAGGAVADVEYLLGIHLRPIQEAKLGQATPALYHGASYFVEASIDGLTAHGARPHLGINAIDAASAVVQAINAIKLNPVVPSSAKVTKLQAGGASANAIPDAALMTFDLRAQKNEVMQELLKKVENATIAGAQMVGAKGMVTSVKGCPAAEYDKQLVALVAESITDVLGKDGLLAPITTPGGEDFHFYTQERPAIKAAYLGLGADLTPGLHDPQMTYDKACLTDGVKIILATVKKILS